ncbi:MAG: hypothetical protein EOP52_07420 [Sphingobacteriales bacterium]|nr:MAG: hypothetical protein EOP52_07420 [Sphingobacteriales bacterium]
MLAVISTLAAGWLTYRADRNKGFSKPWRTALLRSLLVLGVWVLLLAPTLSFQTHQLQRPTVVLLQDDSRSIGAALNADTGAFRKTLDRLSTQLEQDARVIRLSFGATVRSDSSFRYTGAFTNISASLEAAVTRSGKRSPAVIILATDGRYNAGSNPLYTTLPITAPVHLLSVGDTALEKDLRIGRIYAPRVVAKGSSFEVRADLLATGLDGYATTASLQGSDGARGSHSFTVSGMRFDGAASYRLQAGKAGIYSYTVQLPIAPGEVNTQNNTRRFYVEVVDQKKKVLLAAAVPHPDIKAIREALSTVEAYEVTVQTGLTPVNMSAYDVAILHGLPASGTSGLAQIPSWFIATPTTSIPELNAAQQTVAIAGGGQRFSYALPPTGFSLFTPPPGIDALLERLPPLTVTGSSWRVAGDAQSLFRQREGSNAPLWALRSGRPAEAVTTGEGLWRWRLAEYRQRKEQRIVDECIRQTVAFLAAGTGDRKFRLELPKWEWNDGEGVVLNGYLLNAGNQSVNDAAVTVTLTDSAGRVRNYTMDRAGSSYRLSLGSLLPGSYRYSGRAVADGKAYTDGGSFVVSDMPIELLQTGADYPFLQNLAGRYRGTVRPWQQADSLVQQLRAQDLLKPRIETDATPKPLIDWKWMFLVLLLIATAEWAIRRYNS